MHEPVLKYRLRYNCSAFRAEQQRHHLRLHIGRETRVRQCLQIHSLQRLIADNPYTVLIRDNSNAHFLHFGNNRTEVIGNCAFHIHITACNRCSRHIGTSFDPVRDHMMLHAMQALNPFNPDNACSCTADNTAHTVQVIG